MSRDKVDLSNTLTKLQLKEAPDSTALLILTFLDVYDDCLLGNLFKFVCKQRRVCTHLLPHKKHVSFLKGISAIAHSFHFSLQNTHLGGRITAE